MWKTGLRGKPKSEVMISDQELCEPRPLSHQGRGGGQRVENHDYRKEELKTTSSHAAQSSEDWSGPEKKKTRGSWQRTPRLTCPVKSVAKWCF